MGREQGMTYTELPPGEVAIQAKQRLRGLESQHNQIVIGELAGDAADTAEKERLEEAIGKIRERIEAAEATATTRT